MRGRDGASDGGGVTSLRIPPPVLEIAGWTASFAAALLAVTLRAHRPAWDLLFAWTVSWLLPLLLLLRRDLRRPRRMEKGEPVALLEAAGVGALLAAAALLRTWNLEGLPERLHNDEMRCGLEALAFLGPNPPPVFDVGWFACPRLGFFLISPFLEAFGRDLFGLRLFAAFFGLLSLAATWGLVRGLLGPRAAILLLALNTVYAWHIHLSRTGFIYVLAPAVIPLVLLAFVEGVGTGRLLPFGVAGVLLGIAVQTYYAAWILAPLLVSFTVALAVVDREGRAARLRGLLVTLLLSVLTAAPLLAVYAKKPASLTKRSSMVWVLGSEARPHVEAVIGSSRPATILAHQVHATLAGLVRGQDTSVQFGMPGPLVPVPLLLPFVAGALLACRRWREPGPMLLLLWVGGTLISGSVLTIDPPFTPRLAGISAVLLVFCAIAFDALCELAASARSASRAALGIALAGGVALWVAASLASELRTWLVVYPASTWTGPRDVIPRVLRVHPEIPVAVFLGPGAEAFDYQSFTFLAPGVRGLNAADAKDRARETAARAVAAGRSVLLYEGATPSADRLLPELLARGARVREEGRSRGGVRWWIVARADPGAGDQRPASSSISSG